MKGGSPQAIATLVEAAGGELIGKTRLQKIFCLLDLVGDRLGFRFGYHLYGPYSDEISIAASDATALGLVEESVRHAAWGGRYSVFKLKQDVSEKDRLTPAISALVKTAAIADSVELELAVTAAFLADSGVANAWNEVERLKPTKATRERLAGAKRLYQKFETFEVPRPLPKIGMD